MRIDGDMARALARLAKIELTEMEQERLCHNLSVIDEFISKLGEVDTEGVEPTTRVSYYGAREWNGAGGMSSEGGLSARGGVSSEGGLSAIGGVSNEGGLSALREDVAVKPLDREILLANAPQRDEACFITPRVVD